MQTSKFNTPSRTRKCILFLLMARSLYCNQGVTTNPYRSQQTKPTFHDFFNLNCKSEHDIHLTEFILCNIQYVGKAEVAFNLRLNNHRKDSKEADPNLACNHNFKDIISTKLVKLIIIDILLYLHGFKKALQVVRERFWVQKIIVLIPFGFNQQFCK